MARQWLCFDFNKPVEVPESPQLPAAHDEQSSSGSSDTSSSSDSSDSEVSKEVSARVAKRPKMVVPIDEPDEVMVASVSYVQHAMIGTTKDWFPYYQGRHYQAACGARLDPDRARFAQSAALACTFAKDPLVSKPGRPCWYNRSAACHRKKCSRVLLFWRTRHTDHFSQFFQLYVQCFSILMGSIGYVIHKLQPRGPSICNGVHIQVMTMS